MQLHVYIYQCNVLILFFSSLAPTAPTNVQATVVNATAITVQWDKPDTDNGIIRGYVIRYDLQTLNVTADSRSVTIGDLLPHTLYVFEVSAATIVEGPSANASATTAEAGTNMYNKVNHKYLYICTSFNYPQLQVLHGTSWQ